jgi:ubiquinol oxidase
LQICKIEEYTLLNIEVTFLILTPQSCRFYTLETVARMPYFSYISMLQLYETLGWWRRSTESKRIHFAEEYNEFHHLLIMESLGGDQQWPVRFFAQHAAVAYYFILILVWASSPTLAYNFSELIEAHAVDTYTEFAESNKNLLLSMQVPPIAREYYETGDHYIFDEFQNNIKKGSRRPKVKNLYDVFNAIKDDEAAHVFTMSACQDQDESEAEIQE